MQHWLDFDKFYVYLCLNLVSPILQDKLVLKPIVQNKRSPLIKKYVPFKPFLRCKLLYAAPLSGIGSKLVFTGPC